MNFKEFAIAELNRVGCQYEVHRKDIMIRCPNHQSSKLKCAVHFGTKTAPGTVHCWVCEYRGHWNKLLVRDLQVKPYDEKYIDGDTIFASAESMLRDINEQDSLAYYTPPSNLKPWTGTWRGLSEDFLKYHDAYLYRDIKRNKNWIHFRIIENKKSIGHVNVRLDLDIKPNGVCPWSIYNDWVNAKRDCTGFIENSNKCSNCTDNKFCTVGTTGITFPKSLNSSGNLSLRAVFPLKDMVDTVVLTEGIYSALRFRSLGIPAFANLGVECYSQYKTTVFHANNVKKFILCFDGDTPGYDHSRSIYEGITDNQGRKITSPIKNEFKSTIVDFPAGNDPGDIPEEKLGPLFDLLGSDKHISYLRL